jgi:hypothetical protein
MNIKNISKFGRSFSILRIPYSFKLLIQELQVMNVQMRIITDENIDQFLNISYSNNIYELLQLKDENANMNQAINYYSKKINDTLRKENVVPVADTNHVDSNVVEEEPILISQQNNTPGSPQSFIPSSPGYAPGSPGFQQSFTPSSPGYAPGSPGYAPGSPGYAPGSPGYAPGSPGYAPESTSSQDLNLSFVNMSKEEQTELLKRPLSEQTELLKDNSEKKSSSILDVEEEQELEKDKKEVSEGENTNSISGDRKIIFTGNASNAMNDDDSSSSTNRKIIL